MLVESLSIFCFTVNLVKVLGYKKFIWGFLGSLSHDEELVLGGGLGRHQRQVSACPPSWHH